MIIKMKLNHLRKGYRPTPGAWERKIYTEREIIAWWTYAYYSSFDITFGDKEVARVLAENDWGGVCKATGQRAICVGETLFLRRKQYILLTNDSREVVDLRIWAEIENKNNLGGKGYEK